MIDRSLRRVYILCFFLVGRQDASAEGDYTPRHGENWINDAPAVAVVKPAVGLRHKSGHKQELVAETFRLRVAQERVATVEAITETEFFYHPVVNSSFAEIGIAYIASFFGVGKDVLEMPGGEGEHGDERLTLGLGFSLGVGHLAVDNLYIVFLCEVAQRLVVGHVFKVHEEADGRAALSATETFEYALGFGHGKRGCAFVVERT